MTEKRAHESPAVLEKRVIARNTAWNAGAKIAQLSSAFVFMPFLIRSFGLTEYGVFLLASSLSAYLNLLDFGVSATTTKYVAEHHARDDHEEFSRLVSNSLAYYGLVGVLALVLLLLFSRFGVVYLGLTQAEESLARNLFAMSGVIALFTWPLSIGSAILQGLQRYDRIARVATMVVMANIVVTSVVLILDLGPVWLLALLGVVAILNGCISCYLAFREIGTVPFSFAHLNRQTMKVIFGYSWVLFALQVTVMVAYQHTDRLLLGMFVGAAAIGLYEPASKLHGVVSELATLPTSALLPAASRMHAQSRSESLRALFIRGTKYTIVFAAPIATSIIVLAQPLLLTWLGPELATHALEAQLFISEWLFFVALQVAFAIFMGTGRLKFLLWFHIAVALLNIVLSLALVRQYQVLGVILGTVIADLLLFPIGFGYALRAFSVSPLEFMKRVALPTYPLLLITAGASAGLSSTGMTDSLPGVIAAGVLAVALYWLAVYLFGFEQDERDDVKSVVQNAYRHLRPQASHGSVEP